MARCRNKKTPLSPIIRDKRVHPLRYHSYLPTQNRADPSVRIQQCAASDNGSLPSGPTHSSRCFSPKARRGSSHGFMHCLASTGSSLKHSARVLVLVIAEYFTDTEYTPLQALRQGAAACCFFMPETAQNNPVHPTEQGGREYSAKKSGWNLCNQTKEKNACR